MTITSMAKQRRCCMKGRCLDNVSGDRTLVSEHVRNGVSGRPRTFRGERRLFDGKAYTKFVRDICLRPLFSSTSVGILSC